MEDLPFAQASENNKIPILAVLQRYFVRPADVLEIGTGTGQHAVYFAGQLPHIRWQPSDRQETCPLSRRRIELANLPNIGPTLALDVTESPWPVTATDNVFSANTAHIMPWPAVEAMFTGVANVLNEGGYFCLYGPFNEQGQYTSPGNARFDRYLRTQPGGMGIRDRQALLALAEAVGLRFIAHHTMPANNQTLVWQK